MVNVWLILTRPTTSNDQHSGFFLAVAAPRRVKTWNKVYILGNVGAPVRLFGQGGRNRMGKCVE